MIEYDSVKKIWWWDGEPLLEEDLAERMRNLAAEFEDVRSYTVDRDIDITDLRTQLTALKSQAQADAQLIQDQQGRIGELGEKLEEANRICQKFVDKVESGRARSKETYAECKAFLTPAKDPQP